MEDIVLAQVRGLLILANAYKAQGNLHLYRVYLNRANTELKIVEKIRKQYERAVA